jgi:hypothetical protein
MVIVDGRKGMGDIIATLIVPPSGSEDLIATWLFNRNLIRTSLYIYNWKYGN